MICLIQPSYCPSIILTHTDNTSAEDRYVVIIDFWHPELTEDERTALDFVYDTRNKFETGELCGQLLLHALRSRGIWVQGLHVTRIEAAK